MKKTLVCGAGGFIGNHLVNDLKSKGHYVIGVDLNYPLYNETKADKFYQLDLRDRDNVSLVVTPDIHQIYQLAADMGGAGYIFTGEHDADIMTNSSLINLNILSEMIKKNIPNIFYSSSACIYPSHNQTDPLSPNCIETSAYPADPDSEYGWEKLFSERLFLSYAKNYNINVRIARFHNVFGPYGSYNNGKEKVPAAICRKVIESNGEIEIWGSGTQTRSFLYIDECLLGIQKIIDSNYNKPINLGSTFSITINDLAMLTAKIAGKNIKLKHIDGPVGVMGRTSHNDLIKSVTGWTPNENLEYGLRKTYEWIKSRIVQC